MGRGDAAPNCQNKCSDIVPALVLAVGNVSSCHFFHESWQVCGLAHGDDVGCIVKNEFLETISKHRRGSSQSRSRRPAWRIQEYCRSTIARTEQKYTVGQTRLDLRRRLQMPIG